MAADVTYLFFQRDTDVPDNGPVSPVIKTTRVMKHGVGGGGKLRSGSAPPVPIHTIIHQSASSRAGSVAPSRGTSVAPRGVSVAPRARGATPSLGRVGISHGPAASSAGARHQRSSSVIRTVRSDGTTGFLTRPPAATTAAMYRRASISGVPSSAQRGFARPSTARIYRAEDFSGPAVVSDGPKPPLVNRSSVFTRSTSVSRAPPPLPPARSTSLAFSPTRTTSEFEVPPPASGSGLWYRRTVSSETPVGEVHWQTPGRNIETTVSLPPRRGRGLHSANEDFRFSAQTSVEKKSPPPDYIFERGKNAMVSLKTRASAARDQLSRHRTLLDRYLPLNLHPHGDVFYNVEYKVGELYDRMPQLDPTRGRSSLYTDDDKVSSSGVLLVAPYRPPKRIPKVELPSVSLKSPAFPPKVSDVRKRARSVLCKVKGDPHYFDY